VTYDQADLFSVPTAGHARRSDPRASHDGAAKVNLPKRCAEVLAGLQAAGRPICATDLWQYVPNQLPNAIVRRCRDLLGKGLVQVELSSPLRWSLTDEGRKAASR